MNTPSQYFTPLYDNIITQTVLHDKRPWHTMSVDDEETHHLPGDGRSTLEGYERLSASESLGEDFNTANDSREKRCSLHNWNFDSVLEATFE